MSEYFEKAKPTYIENWPKGLHAISFSSVPVKLSLKEARALGAEIMEWGETFGARDRASVERVKERLKKILSLFLPQGVFVRLGSRSPKDSWSDAGPAKTTDEVIKRLTDCSERMHDDLQLALHNHYEPSIWLRGWCDDLGDEFRCIIKDRRLVAVSQYEYKKSIPSISDNSRTIVESIMRYIKQDFLPLCHLDDVVVDLAVRGLVDGWHPITMIEINPFFEFTDLCLFDWRFQDQIEAGSARWLVGDEVKSQRLRPMKFSTNIIID